MTRNKQNEYVITDDYAIIKVYSNTHGNFDILIDLEDVERCKLHSWGVMRSYHRKNTIYYIYARYEGKVILLHRFIHREDRKGYMVDHINGNTCDNRKNNLRAVTARQNSLNKKHENNSTESGYRGVFWYHSKGVNKWVAHIYVNYKRIHIGYFDELEDAIAARKEAEIKYYGEYNREHICQ